MNYPSKLIEEAVNAFALLPGIGKKTALRLTLHLLKKENFDALRISKAIADLSENIQYCSTCHNVSDAEICGICSNLSRNQTIVCVVADMRDVMAIEQTDTFKGTYHVLGGLISPVDGVTPDQINILSLIERVKTNTISELIFALSATMEGDTTNFYIYKQIENYEVKTSTIARGISVGDELEYADEVTLGRSILNRVPFENSLKSS